jgi:hypothetical protein
MWIYPEAPFRHCPCLLVSCVHLPRYRVPARFPGGGGSFFIGAIDTTRKHTNRSARKASRAEIRVMLSNKRFRVIFRWYERIQQPSEVG